MLLVGALLIAGAARAQDPCPGGRLPNVNLTPVVIDKDCNVYGGGYDYADINIVAGGRLIFDGSGPTPTSFHARSIIIENGGKLIAGSLTDPYNGSLDIVLWGNDQGFSGRGVGCKSPPGNDSRVGQCGIPNDIWDSNGARKVPLTGGDDYFYQYAPLPFDDGGSPNVGYFGYKVLAVSYGGTLQLFGKKGATYADLGHKDSGQSWTRLDGTIKPGMTTLKVAGPVDWQRYDRIVVTTTDYVPNHSEELQICTISGNTITFTRDLTPGGCIKQLGVQWTHNGQQYPLDRLPGRLNIAKKAAETRAAVALLTRSIRIVSGGDAYDKCFPPCRR